MSWDQLPAYFVGEFAGGLIGALAYTALAASRGRTKLESTTTAVGTPS
ncbi:hypothetical protein [Microbispora sp. GKU 823]|nr:hypothetical protein [Microbispora sp. GKU 823]